MRVDVRQKDVYSEYCEHIVNVLKIDSLEGGASTDLWGYR